MKNVQLQAQKFQNRQGSSQSPQNPRERSREKNIRHDSTENHVYRRKFMPKQKKLDKLEKQPEINNVFNLSKHSQVFAHHNAQNDKFKEVIRSLLRIQQGRDQAIDKIAKIAWTFKNKIKYDRNLHEIMTDPKAFISKLSSEQISSMIPVAEEHLQYEIQKKSNMQQYWNCIIGILQRQYERGKNPEEQIKLDYKYKIRQIIEKPLPELIKLQKQATLILKNQSFGSSNEYWKFVLQEVKAKKIELTLQKYYQDFKSNHQDLIESSFNNQEQYICQEPTSPTLIPYTSVNSKLIVTEQQEKESRKKLAEVIFREEFQKGQQRLQRNLSLPHNHSLLSTEIITQQTNTYDQIAKEIIEFEKYKRMQDDEEQFNDWVPCETEGRFRDQKPFYLNRVRVACQWNKYNSNHYSQENPPPKTIQGYKFNIFYPELYDKQKTPQYYFQNMDDPNFCIIKFKAGPPYKDIAFKILKKEWDFTQKSGFQSIFSKGILQLYFNFKKPKYRI